MLGNGRKRWTTMILLTAGMLVIVSGLLVHGTSPVAEAQSREIILDRGRLAYGARLHALADFHLMGGSSRGRAADAARLTARAEHFLSKDKASCDAVLLTRGQKADAARLTGLAVHYLGSSVPRMVVLNRGQVADSMRLTGMASSLGATLSSSRLACALGQ